MNIILLYISCQSKGEGEVIVQYCFEQSLIGSASVIPVTDFFEKDSMVQNAQECIVVAKTLETHAVAVMDHLQKKNLNYSSCLVQVLNSSDRLHLQILESQLKSV